MRGSLSSIWYPSVICLAKAEIRKSRIIASLSTAEDGAMSFEEGTRMVVDGVVLVSGLMGLCSGSRCVVDGVVEGVVGGCS